MSHPFTNNGTTTGVCIVCGGPVTVHEFAIIRLINCAGCQKDDRREWTEREEHTCEKGAK